MQPIISQALVATRVADMRREAEITQLAGDVKRARRRARRRARIQPVRRAQPAGRPERAGLRAG
jgi:hypothetical protein